jgi:hypothetical protein
MTPTNPQSKIINQQFNCSSFDLHIRSFHRFNHGFSFIIDNHYREKELFRNCSMRAGGIKPHCAIPQARACGIISIPLSLSLTSTAYKEAPFRLEQVAIFTQKSTILNFLGYHYTQSISPGVIHARV